MSEQVSGQVVRVLVVDDDVAVASLHQAYVGTLPGFACIGVVHRGADALRAVEALAPDLVLLDVHLPDLPGTEVLRALRASGSDVDVVVVTAARELEVVRTSMAGGVADYLVKPFSLALFTERMQAYAAHRRALALTGASGGLGQDDVDRLLHPGGTAGAAGHGQRTPEQLPKGLSHRSLELVVQVLRSAAEPDLSAGEVAARCGMARVSARRYLEHLEQTGRAVVRPRYGVAGRPENGYAWVHR
ncbi:two-component system, CitB family, response regulator [Quadrisphaera granulorum]|uniref:Transcriptional regulatory protein n=1 Tax=Quadrisphaera granulorum TaxID=317664 RepID=A0A316ACC8_9ACTN|nr:response regulator [Quadrisphaera granulorum]PWJ55373.1 two-component system CitB family response regulator [Quadrisphaera granulorum]SZE95437.1 two-component system, CitB family, response regulator [Quadrisphaera granulorum]